MRLSTLSSPARAASCTELCSSFAPNLYALLVMSSTAMFEMKQEHTRLFVIKREMCVMRVKLDE